MVKTGEEKKVLNKIKESISNLDLNNTKKACLDGIKIKIDPYHIITDGLSPGIEIVGQKYEDGEYFLIMELIMAGEIMKECLKDLDSHLKVYNNVPELKTGTVVIGAVKGDLHDIGKNIVITLLKAHNFKVYDLGSDVPAEKFVESIKKYQPDILGISALLTNTTFEIENVINLLEKEKLRHKVKVIIGGNAVNEQLSKKVGSDAWSISAVRGIQQCKKWMKKE
jgi:5-methyltetrahydrofolate--homocysteine methyltransferase